MSDDFDNNKQQWSLWSVCSATQRRVASNENWGEAHNNWSLTWKIDKSQVEYVWRVDSQVDGHRRYAFVMTSGPVGLILDLFADLIEIGKLLASAVKELSVLCRKG